jgi:DNA-binding NtrC family response regulator
MVLLKKPIALGTTPHISAGPMDEGPRKSGGQCTMQRHARILVVDDDPQMANGLSRIIGRMGIKAVVAAPDEALEMFRNGRFDLVVTDLDMPEICGTELTRQMLEIEPHARVVIHTANDSMTFGQLTETGARDVLRKPATMNAIIETIDRNLMA